MIGRLHGQVVDHNLDGSVVVDVGGVGYEVFVPLGNLGRLPPPPEAVILHVHTHVRQDTFTLFGFASATDREAFRILLSVSGVGPKLALAILGALPARELAQAIASQDRAPFKNISGVGKKTAERLLLELKDKLGPLFTDAPVPMPSAPDAPAPAGPLAVVAAALVQMGYRQAEANLAVAAVGEADGREVGVLLREALGHLG
ncbi:MAG: Holliday junction branch migration protein RuvA [Deltaproteobacteria bacterium]|nr:MAG: Holliday junction branch migration protein RuvA [Deltaproteobacteria bacterium]